MLLMMMDKCDLLCECKFYECLNVIDYDRYDVIYCMNENPMKV
jgi:hypothetical protein